jgi:hypothetical protein
MAGLIPPQNTKEQSLLATLSEFPLFLVRLFVYPRQLVRSLDWDDPATLRRVALYAVIWLAILVLAFSDNRQLFDEQHYRLSTFKSVVMKAHDHSFDWMEPAYSLFNTDQREAKLLWDILLTSGFLAYTFFAAMLATAVVARLRMWRSGISWPMAIGTGLLGLMAAASCIALSLVPLALLFICRICAIRPVLFVLLNLASWTYVGYYSLADLGERPRAWHRHLGKSFCYGLVQYAIAYVICFVLVCTIIPI